MPDLGDRAARVQRAQRATVGVDIGKIDAFERKRRSPAQRLQVGGRTSAEVVESADLLAALEHGARQIAADESRDAGDEDGHDYAAASAAWNSRPSLAASVSIECRSTTHR